MLVIQSDGFNSSRIQTIVVAVITTNLNLVRAPGNVSLPARDADLKKDSVINVSQLMTIDRTLLTGYAGSISSRTMNEVNSGLRLVLSL